MQKYDAIEVGIKNNDVKALRSALGSICYTNRDFSSGKFDEAVKYVEAKGIEIREKELVGEPPISSQKSEFTDEDFGRAVFELKENFCDERIQDVKTIGKKLYATKPQTQSRVQDGRPLGTRESGGKDPNAASHQQSRIPIILGLMAAVIIIVLIILIVK